MKYIVYCTTNIINKKIYIGVHQTVDPEKFDGYIGNGVYVTKPSTYNKSNTVFLRAVLKYGVSNFKRVVIKVFDKEEDAYDLEEYIVNKDFLQRKDVYNTALGGRGGDINNNAKPCYQYTLDGDFVKEYSSQLLASFAVNRGFTTIKRAIRTKVQSAGYFWSLIKCDKLDITEYKTENNYVPVFLYNSNGEYECCYDKVSVAANVNSTSTSNIYRSCKLGFKCNNKYFSYEYLNTYSKAKQECLKHTTVYLYSLSGEYIAEYSNYLEALKSLNKSSGLLQALRMERTFAGYLWKLVKLEHIPAATTCGKARKVAQYDLEGNLVCTYNTVSECTKKYSGALHVLKGTRKTAGGYTFKYLDN